TYTAAGDYTVTLAVSNACDAITATHVIRVVAACEPVHGVAFTWSPPSPRVGETVAFTGTAVGTLPISYTWSFGDGGTASGVTATHTYSRTGAFRVVLTATNCVSAAVSVSHTLEMAPYSIYLPLVLRGYPPWERLLPEVGNVRAILFVSQGEVYLAASDNAYRGSGCDLAPVQAMVLDGGARTLAHFDGALWAGNANGVWRYRQGSWEAMNDGLGNTSIWALQVCADALYAGTDAGVYARTAGDGSWLYRSEGLSGTALLIDTFLCQDNTLYVGTWGAGVFRWDGSRWQPLGRQGLDEPARRVWALLPLEGGIFYIGTEGGLYLSTDMGNTWTRAADVPIDKVGALVRGPSGRLYAGTEGHGVYSAGGSRRPWYPLGRLAGNAAFVHALAVWEDCPYLYSGTVDGVWRYPQRP
ncbi:MAG: PKD domain-containing protein, partial [Chloroflexia bacterium]